jgi:two-component system response regulator YesN
MMMYRVMIVDDEPIIRRGIRNSIAWNEHEMEIVGEAANGQEALDIADRLQPDIVIADICMPEIDGLEMSERLLMKYPDIKIIILTGYDEFEYAQRACKLGVVDYVLKPTDADDLLAVLENTKKSINSEQNSRIKMKELEQQLQKHMPVIRENYLVRLITGVQTLQELDDNQRVLNIQDRCGIFQVAVLDYDSTLEDSSFTGHVEMLHFAVKNICKEMIDEQNLGWTFYNALGQITILFYFQEEKEEPARLIFDLMDKIQQMINKTLKAAFSIGIGRGYERIKNIKRSYEEAKEALEYRFITGENSILFIDDVQAGCHEPKWNDLLKIEKEILVNISKEKEDIILLLLDRFFEQIKSQPAITPLWAKAKCYELVSNLYLAFNDLAAQERRLEKTPDELYHDIHQSVSLSSAFALVENFVREILTIISQARNNRTRKLIEMGKEYIQQHFNEEISVADIAGHLYVTPNYFSRIFKKETGEGCIEYINRVRMEEAKKLLKSTLYLTYEIGNMVGFKDANYFSLAFKKYTGMSPTEYRDSGLV